MEVMDAPEEKVKIPLTECKYLVNPIEDRGKKKGKNIHADASRLQFKKKLRSLSLGNYL